MCGSNGNSCCPSAQVFQEKICGNLQGPLPWESQPGFTAWNAPAVNDYFQGTFEIFNAGPDIITARVLNSTGEFVDLSVPAGNSVSISFNNPDSFVVFVPEGTNGKFCINLYKRIFA